MKRYLRDGLNACSNAETRLAYVPAVLFVAVGGAMNWSFAATLGTDDLTRLCWQAFAVASTCFTAVGPALVWRNAKAGDRWRAAAAAIVLTSSLTYDVIAAYGLATREQHVLANHEKQARDRHADARREVERLQGEWQKVASAPAVIVGQATVRVQRDRINPANCKLRKISDELRRQCDDLSAAEQQLAAAEAKAAIEPELAKARETLKQTPEALPADPRVELLGETLVHWLPVFVLTVGALLCPFCIPARRAEEPAKQPGTFVPAPRPTRETSLELSSTCNKTRDSIPAAPSGAPAFASQILALYDQPPPGSVLDTDGWLRAPQRKLAAQAGIPVARLNRDLKAAHLIGEIELDTTNGTAFRPKR